MTEQTLDCVIGVYGTVRAARELPENTAHLITKDSSTAWGLAWAEVRPANEPDAWLLRLCLRGPSFPLTEVLEHVAAVLDELGGLDLRGVQVQLPVAGIVAPPVVRRATPTGTNRERFDAELDFGPDRKALDMEEHIFRGIAGQPVGDASRAAFTAWASGSPPRALFDVESVDRRTLWGQLDDTIGFRTEGTCPEFTLATVADISAQVLAAVRAAELKGPVVLSIRRRDATV